MNPDHHLLHLNEPEKVKTNINYFGGVLFLPNSAKLQQKLDLDEKRGTKKDRDRDRELKHN